LLQTDSEQEHGGDAMSSHIVYYLNEAEAKAHGEVKAVVNLLRVHRLKPASEKPMRRKSFPRRRTK
jgi:hypothetical protein